MPVVQVATEFGDDDLFSGRNFRKARISLPHFKRETLGAVAHRWSSWSISAEPDPIAIIFAGKIVLEAVPRFLRLIEPIYVPDPLQIIGTFPAHKIDNVPVSCDIPRRTCLGAPVPFSIPAKPVSVRLRPPLDQNGGAKILRIARPGAKISIEIASDTVPK